MDTREVERPRGFLRVTALSEGVRGLPRERSLEQITCMPHWGRTFGAMFGMVCVIIGINAYVFEHPLPGAGWVNHLFLIITHCTTLFTILVISLLGFTLAFPAGADVPLTAGLVFCICYQPCR
jgi:hypothetical protein